MKYFILTGASRGFGRAVTAELLKNPSNSVFAIARNNPGHTAKNFVFVKQDLTLTDQIPALIESVFKQMHERPSEVFLINNAGTVLPMGPLHMSSVHDINAHVQLNFVAAMLLSASFIRKLNTLNLRGGIVNITSGASQKPFFGWTCYCSTKAALKMMTDCLAIENPKLKIETYDPGVVDTQMQADIRSQSASNFPSIGYFKDLLKNNMLQSSEEAALKFVRKVFITAVA